MHRIARLLPRLFMGCLFVCACSGLVLLCHYRPFGDVFAGVETMTAAPFGFFFRNLHRVSGQCSAILALFHVADHVARGTAARFVARTWAHLIGCAVLCVWLLLTGYVLAGDLRGVQAGTVLRSLVESVPLLGERIGPLLIGHGEEFFLPPYVLHCFLAPLALAALLARHARSLLPRRAALLTTLAALGLYALAVPLPPAIAPDSPVTATVHGPWIFLGLQHLLQLGPVWLAILLPSVFMALLLVLPLLRTPWHCAVRLTLTLGITGYAALSLAPFF